MTDTYLEDFATRMKPRQASNILLWAIIAFFVIFVAWAALTELDRTVHAQGRVIPSARLQVVSNLEGGIIRDILVKSGDMVKQGQPLVRMDKTLLGADLGTNQANVNALRMKIARLEAEIAGRVPAYPAAQNAAEEEQLRIETSLHAARMGELSGLTSAARARLQQTERAVHEGEAAYQSRVSARDSARTQLEMIRPLVEHGIEPRMMLVQMESSAAVATTDAASAAAGVARSKAAVAEARSALAQVQEDWRAQAATELAAAQAELTARSSANTALADKVARTSVLSPLSGRVNRVLVTTVGGVVRAGEPLVEVVPGEDNLLIEARVVPKDIAFIRPEQDARINISAYDTAVYGSMRGKVVSISPDATVDEKSGESFYIVRVRGNAKSLTDHSGRPLPIGPGMTADVNLLGDKRSVLKYLLTPITRLSEQAFRE
ncbi:HlyD family type I secretion periplasmic adaptor subunit [Hephaestia sp. GCM10023244]|uniref:HlyD family type I secretion periplasmic adaptor subunit n=1 Tax=unclassified Hephaestia TaxID=2631281 RepID=UPI0020775F32|nr:HlyD family type I secretion periplasmic adaptor subunit [Hephaestia sp. MAHUQ-44]MCM8732014.1 HlyD family type I secretion periplasmic adaptor subunit [Hephaestia sp. MAHUQ-44]